MHKNSSEQGFTLIELIVVIVILGILAAFAIPRFVNLQNDARRSVLQGVSGSLQAASALAYSKALVSTPAQTGTSGTISVPGAGTNGTVALAYGYPTGTSISTMLQDTTNFGVSAIGTTATFWPTSAGNSANCNVVYTAATTSVGTGSTPTVVTNSSDCS
ncbi:MAG: type II secretion system protein [Acidithiobacillus ferrooxidans]|nr:type II secretion system protein [Acidithiobacillus ferrooxidans]MDD5002685.1 type II secretion system protein [Acidithiobacillus sp.]MDD5377599.1 type II secretion system protein [Acidithiobacillus sp.]MDD5575607.1 type II secretion system protein [Acidithiobacillus sp.]